jgi:hypothetical protein
MDIDALEIVPFNRFGNNFHQLLNAAVLAPKMGIRDILFPQSFTRGASAGCTLAGLRFLHQADPSVGRALSGHYFWIEPFEHLFAQVSPRQMFDTLTNCIQPLYNGLISRAVPAHDEYVMHFHFRSGDIFRSAKTHGSYVQPPLSYFRAALRHAVEQYGVRRAVLVYEDTGNPCVLAFKNYLESIAFEHCVQSASLEEDICELLRARIICYGLATFVESILCLSSHARVAYAFRDPEFGAGLNKPRGCGIREMLLLKGMTLHVGTDTGSGYISKDGWMNTAQQRELMLNYPEDALKLATL